MNPVSLRLKNNIRTHKSDCILQRAEKSLLNERARNINNILKRLDHERYIYQVISYFRNRSYQKK